MACLSGSDEVFPGIPGNIGSSDSTFLHFYPPSPPPLPFTFLPLFFFPPLLSFLPSFFSSLHLYLFIFLLLFSSSLLLLFSSSFHFLFSSSIFLLSPSLFLLLSSSFFLFHSTFPLIIPHSHLNRFLSHSLNPMVRTATSYHSCGKCVPIANSRIYFASYFCFYR